MKHCVVFIFLLIFFQSNFSINNDKIVVKTAKINDLNSDSSYLTFYGSFIKDDFIHYYTIKDIFEFYSQREKVKVDTNLRFREKIQAFQEFTFNIDEMPTPFIFFSGDSVEIKINDHNNYRLYSSNNMKQNEINLQCQIHVEGKNDVKFAFNDSAKIQDNWLTNLRIIYELAQKNSISKEFYNYYKVYLTCRYINQLIAPILFNEKLNYNININNLVDLIPKDVFLARNLYSYRQTLLILIKSLAHERYKSKSFTDLVKVIESTFDAELRDYLIVFVYKYLDYLNQVDEDDHQYMLLIISPDYKKYIREDFSTLSFSDDILFNSEGATINISELINKPHKKLIYIDFWASWCAPCKEEFQYYPELMKDYKDKVDFYFISIDQSINNWTNVCANYAFLTPKISFVINDFRNSSIHKLLKINSIPRYIIIYGGNIINSDAKRPSDPNLRRYLEQGVNSTG